MAAAQKLRLKITQASLNQTAFDWPRNMTNIFAAVREAAAQGSDILALEELALTGYEANDEYQRTDNTRITAALSDIARYAASLAPNLIISIGHPWRLQMRDVPPDDGLSFERARDPLYDRLSLPFNVQTILAHGRVAAMTAKTNLFNDERGYEKRYFNEWSATAAERIGGTHGSIFTLLPSQNTPVPMGLPILYVGDGTKGFHLAQAICEMKWVASRYDGHPHDDSRYDNDNVIPWISRTAGGRNGLVLLIPNASPPARDKVDKHVHLNRLAGQYADAVVDTDGLGSSGSTFAQFGHRMVVQDGNVTSYGHRLSFNRAAFTTSTIEIDSVPRARAFEAHGAIDHEFANDKSGHANTLAYRDDPRHAWDAPQNPDRHYEEVVRYTALWLFDYMRKSNHKGIMEALSGGADSAFNSVIVSAMVHIGINELGAETFCDELKLKNKEAILAAETAGGAQAAIDVCMKDMLTGVYMGTDNSSDATREAARFLIEGGIDPATGEHVRGIGGKFVSRNVQDLLDFYGTLYAVENTRALDPLEKHAMMTDIAAHLNMSPHTTNAEDCAESADALRQKYPQIDDLVTAADGVVYENIQARGREVLVLLFANKEGKMAVANPNLDEARNAYATFGGDLHSGTINLNAHLPKAYQLDIMRYLYEKGLHGVMEPVRGLALVMGNKPTAELQPKDAQGNVVQHDEDALQRNFDQMNRISEYMLYQRAHDRDGDRRLNATEIFGLCETDPLFEGVGDNMLYNMLRLSYKRWDIAQHKIHAAPVGPTYGRNVDHQTSFRMPNLHGQSKDELAALGVGLMFRWADDDGAGWSGADRAMLDRRTWQDEAFIRTFDVGVWSGSATQEYDLRRFYADIKTRGWDGVFAPLAGDDPIMVVHGPQPGMTP